MQLTKVIAENIVKIRYCDLPDNVIEASKKSILDSIAVTLPATTLDKSCIALYDLVMEAGGKEESTIIGFGGKSTCWMAAFINGCLVHALDYDDTTDDPIYHPTGSTFPAAFAIAERLGGISGKDFITAIALGNDLGIRLTTTVKDSLKNHSIFSTSMFGPFGAAAAVGKLLGLSTEKMLNALGIALHRVTGDKEALWDPGSDIRAIRDGYTNKEGVLAGLMASRGIAACKDSFENLFKFFYDDDFNPEPLTKDLGKKFRGSDVSIKPWPAVRGSHGYIETALQIMKEHRIQPDQIKEVVLTVDESHAERFHEPFPTSAMAAKFSLPFVVSVALIKGVVEIPHFIPDNFDPNVLEMSTKIKYTVDASFGSTTPAQTDIWTKDGKNYSSRMDRLTGHPQKPLSNDEITRKFEDCASYSRRPVKPETIKQLIETINNLDKLADVREISNILY